MCDDFAVFIISHQRAETMSTYEALIKAGFTGTLYIVIDNEDKQLDLYKSKYKNKLLVFNKDEYINKSETMDNYRQKSSALYARNFCYEYAEKIGLKAFLQLDDDITNFGVRYEENGRLKSKKIENINVLLSAMYTFIMCNDNIKSVSFCNAGGLMGGVNGKFKNGLGRTINQAMMLKVDKKIRFLGTITEDFNICARYANEGFLFFEYYPLTVSSPTQGSNVGGIDYSNMYVAFFYAVMLVPSACKIKIQNGKAQLLRKQNSIFPKILNERWKK